MGRMSLTSRHLHCRCIRKYHLPFFSRCWLKAYYFNFYFNFICDSGVKGSERKGGRGGKRLEMNGEEGGSLREDINIK